MYRLDIADISYPASGDLRVNRDVTATSDHSLAATAAEETVAAVAEGIKRSSPDRELQM
jgi:hypothetical protein